MFLKRITYRKVERKVASEVGRDNRITVASFVHGVDSLHTAVEADNQEIQVETDAQTVCHSQLLVEAVEVEDSVGTYDIAELLERSIFGEDTVVETEETEQHA